MGSIYRIYCTSTKQNYIGQSIDSKKRWAQHVNELRKGKHHSHKLQEAYWNFGESCLRFEVLENDIDISDMTSREAYWMKEHEGYTKGFNVQYVGHVNAKPVIPFSARKNIPPPPLAIVQDDKQSPFGSTPTVPPKQKTRDDMIMDMVSDALNRVSIELNTWRYAAEDEVRRLRAENEILIRENAVLRWRLGADGQAIA